ncbi:MAG TPA: glycosyltransferase [Crenotrichaceae bacterium]|nr:glycosyltransferase [Crenotrichaceae bacterium]
MLVNKQPVLLLCPSLIGAGVERRIYLLVNQLKQDWSHLKLGLLREEGQFLSRVDVAQRVYVPPDSFSRFFCFPLKQFQEPYYFLLAIGQIKMMQERIRPAVVMTFTLETTLPMFFARFLVSGHRPVWVISEDSNTAVAAGNVCKFEVVNVLLKNVLGYVYRHADFITTVSSTVQDSVEQQYGIPVEKINVIHNPVDSDGIRKSADNNRPFNFEYIIAVGRLVKVKQFDLLINAFSHVYKSHAVQLVILGEGPEKKHLQQLAADLKLADVIHFPGFVNNPWVYMKYAKMLVLSSRIEGFGNVITEAMTIGCPVIATACGGPADIIKHNSNGLIADQDALSVAHAITRLLDSPELSRSLSSQALLDAEKYHPIHSSACFNDMLLELLNSTNHHTTQCHKRTMLSIDNDA